MTKVRDVLNVAAILAVACALNAAMVFTLYAMWAN